MGPVKNPAGPLSGQPGNPEKSGQVIVPAGPEFHNPALSVMPPPAQSTLSVSSLFSTFSNSPPEAFKQAVSVLGLPQDALSFTLITLTRLFSLPMDGFLPGLRREVLAGAVSVPKNSGEKAKTEARALAAASAAAKGVGLSPEALEEYAQALGGGFGDNRNGGKNSGNGADNDGAKDGNAANEALNAGELRRLFDEFMESGGGESGEKGLVSFLNRIPAKNGRRWALWPFNIAIGGVDLRVFIRILKREEGSFSALPDRLIADISGPRRHWRLVADKGGGAGRAEISVYPGLPPGELKALQMEAGAAFAGMGAEIKVLNRANEEEFLEENLLGMFFPGETLPAVNEEV
jgi:hypothetical protein